MATKKKGPAPRGAQQVDSLTLTDLDQVKVLADPLRIRILEELCATTGWHRKHAVRALGRHGTVGPAGDEERPSRSARTVRPSKTR